jgi:signal transduction histidine kinase
VLVPQKVSSILRGERPVLRVQLTLLYSGLFLGVLASVLFATNLLSRHTASRAPEGVPAAPVASGHGFDVAPALIGLVAAFVAVAGAWWLAGRFLRPLRAITATAQEISASNLHRRLTLTGPSDELTDLGATLNDLFGRLEAAFDAQRHFIANASHELRSPLTAERTLLQVALADPDATTEMWRATGEKVLKWSNHQQQLIDALLSLATSERGIEKWEPFDLAQIAGSVLLGRKHEAHLRAIRIDATLVSAQSTGDPTLIELLIANLVDNALRHNVTGGTIEVATISPPGRASITVTNTGPIITHADLERLFRPFQQVGAERVRHTDGHGLGLAIVQAIARAHGAHITAQPRQAGGLDVTVSFASSEC